MLETVMSMELSVPLYQLILLMVSGTALLIFGRPKWALFANYCFIFYWAYIANTEVINPESLNLTKFTLLYFGFGLVVLVLAVAGLLTHHD
jgi:hypothetical protein